MNKNKMIKLKEIGYVIRETCLICDHSEFTRPSNFGFCKIHTCVHRKHTGPPKQLGVHQTGRCEHFARNEPAISFGLWEDLFEGS